MRCISFQKQCSHINNAAVEDIYLQPPQLLNSICAPSTATVEISFLPSSCPKQSSSRALKFSQVSGAAVMKEHIFIVASPFPQGNGANMLIRTVPVHQSL